jgi:hypothetical protein
MTTFESEIFSINSKNAFIARFLSDPQNLNQILPSDHISDWSADEFGCSFKIKNLAHIYLKLSNVESSKVVFVSNDERPFSFELVISIQPNGKDSSNLSASFIADVNTFMGAMLKTPLTNFLNSLGNQIKKKYL